MPSPEVEFLQEYHIGRKEKAKTQHQPEKDLASSEDISGRDAELSHTWIQICFLLQPISHAETLNVNLG